MGGMTAHAPAHSLLWLHRPGGKGYHELKIMKADGSEFTVLTPDVDVYDSAIYCGN